MKEMAARERLIVALDLPSTEEAFALVRDLEGSVSFFKVGWELFLSGGLERLLEALGDKQVFLDLKIPDDIGETIRRLVAVATRHGVRLMTFAPTVTRPTLRAAAEGRGEGNAYPELLAVPLWSSLNAADVEQIYGEDGSRLDDFVVSRGGELLDKGCDGLILSGESIRRGRERFPEITIVSPGIRPAGSPSDDHKRFTTPAEAVAMGADYLVVGRPIRNARGGKARREMAEAIVADIEEGLRRRNSRPGATEPKPRSTIG